MLNSETVTNVVIAPGRHDRADGSPVLPFCFYWRYFWVGTGCGVVFYPSRTMILYPKPGGWRGNYAAGQRRTGCRSTISAGRIEPDCCCGRNPTWPYLWQLSLLRIPGTAPVKGNQDYATCCAHGIRCTCRCTAQASECVTPEWWVPYVVQTDDTLPALAELRGIEAEAVLAGNCLTDSDLTEGQIVLLPPLATVIDLISTAMATIQPLPDIAGSDTSAISSATTQTPVAPLPSPTPFASATDEAPAVWKKRLPVIHHGRQPQPSCRHVSFRQLRRRDLNPPSHRDRQLHPRR
ncbi:MAG: LysM peptidoglycan-binding domain-containing protein [Chloroflexota bacterium]